jgi:alpha-glucosidase
MQWDASKNAGFSAAPKTWLPIPPSAAQYNVAAERKDPNSILNFYKRLLALRRSNAALRDGTYVALNREDANVLSFLRRNPGAGDSVLVALNMSAQPQTVAFDLAQYGLKEKTAVTLLTAPEATAAKISVAGITIPPFGVLIAGVR